MQNRKAFKILMTADTVGGVWSYAVELIQALAPGGVEVALATMGAPLNLQQREQLTGLPQVKLYESNYKLEWMDNCWADVKAAGTWLMQIKKEFKPDLIHLNNLVHGNLNWGKPVMVTVHSCVLSWWRAVKKEEATADWNIYREQVKASLRAVDLVVAPSQAMLKEAEALYGPFLKQRVIYNGRNTDLYRYKLKEPFIFSMGRIWDEAKNIKLLAQVAANLNWPIYVAGDQAHPDNGKTQQLENIHFLGKLSQVEVANFLSRAAIFALPAKYEPFGLSALEAALSGCALVLSNIESQREIWGNAATYINPDNPEVIKRVLNKLINDEFMRNIMGFRAMQKGLPYSARQMAFEYSQAYQELMGDLKTKSTKEKILI